MTWAATSLDPLGPFCLSLRPSLRLRLRLHTSRASLLGILLSWTICRLISPTPPPLLHLTTVHTSFQRRSSCTSSCFPTLVNTCALEPRQQTRHLQHLSPPPLLPRRSHFVLDCAYRLRQKRRQRYTKGLGNLRQTIKPSKLSKQAILGLILALFGAALYRQLCALTTSFLHRPTSRSRSLPDGSTTGLDCWRNRTSKRETAQVWSPRFTHRESDTARR